MRKSSLITVIAFSVLLGSLTLINFIAPQKEMSENENRYLKQFAKPTLKTVFDGSFERDFESYMNDQMVCRDSFITLKQYTQRLLGSSELNGVYVGKDGYFIEAITKESANWQQYEKNCRAITEFLKESGLEKEHQSVMVVPTAGLVLKDKLPENAPMIDQNVLLKEWKNRVLTGSFIDVRMPLANCEAPYYKTDHHWTTEGAYQAYIELCTQKNLSNQDAYEHHTVTTSFFGTLYSKALLPCKPDTITLYTNKNQEELCLTGDGEPISLYEKPALKTKSKYEVFLGGNYSEVQVKTKVKNGGKLLIIKDSFANSFLPFLTGEFEEISMLDLRYYQGSALEYIKEHKITDVLFLYGIKTLFDDTNLPKLGF
ncbi:MAG: DHHW family protein [Lachnospiraceae bacterium]